MILRIAKFSLLRHLIFADSIVNENMKVDGGNKLRVALRK